MSVTPSRCCSANGPPMESLAAAQRFASRRHCLVNLGQGLAGLALGVLLHRDSAANQPSWSPPTGLPHFPPKAKNVIWLFMNGGVSHMESFDPKPMLTKYAGKTINETPYADVLSPEKLNIERVALPIGARANTLYPLQDNFRKYGESGIEVCNNF